MDKNMTYILRIKGVLDFALSEIPKGGKNSPFIYPALNASILIRNDSLTSEKSKAKKLFVNTWYVPPQKSTPVWSSVKWTTKGEFSKLKQFWITSELT